MKFYKLRPEVPANNKGGTLESDVKPARVTSVSLEFEYPLRSEIITTRGAYVVTAELADALRQTDFTGFEFGPVTDVTVSPRSEYRDDISVPPLECLVVTGIPMRDDFGLQKFRDLVVSERAARWLVARDPSLRMSTRELDSEGNLLFPGRSLTIDAS